MYVGEKVLFPDMVLDVPEAQPHVNQSGLYPPLLLLEQEHPSKQGRGDSDGLRSQARAGIRNHRVDAMTCRKREAHFQHNPRFHTLHKRNAQFASVGRFRSRTAVLKR